MHPKYQQSKVTVSAIASILGMHFFVTKPRLMDLSLNQNSKVDPSYPLVRALSSRLTAYLRRV